MGACVRHAWAAVLVLRQLAGRAVGHLRRVNHLCRCLGSGSVGLLDLATARAGHGVHSTGPGPQAMIYTLHIDKEEPGLYTGRILDGWAEVAEFQAANISGTIRDCAVGTLSGLDGFHICTAMFLSAQLPSMPCATMPRLWRSGWSACIRNSMIRPAPFRPAQGLGGGNKPL